MSIRLIGAVLILSGCGWFGFSMANAHRKLENALHQLTRGLEWMEWELQFRQTPLPELCGHTANVLSGPVGKVFSRLEGELQSGSYAQVSECMDYVLQGCRELPEKVRRLLSDTGRCLGQFDVKGQLNSLRAIRKECETEGNYLALNRETRLRSYQTLGLCAGAALAVLLL